jgi:hypothetical protein
MATLCRRVDWDQLITWSPPCFREPHTPVAQNNFLSIEEEQKRKLLLNSDNVAETARHLMITSGPLKMRLATRGKHDAALTISALHCHCLCIRNSSLVKGRQADEHGRCARCAGKGDNQHRPEREYGGRD